MTKTEALSKLIGQQITAQGISSELKSGTFTGHVFAVSEDPTYPIEVRWAINPFNVGIAWVRADLA